MPTKDVVRRIVPPAPAPAAAGAVTLVTLVALLAGACSTSTKPKATGGTTTAPARAATGNGLRPGAEGGPGLPAATTTSPPALPRPLALVAVTTAGAVQTLDPATGQLVKTLATGATGDAIGLTPDGVFVFFETPAGCTHQINRVATTAGRSGPAPPAMVVGPGSKPTVSPDGTQLAYIRQPNIAANSTACQGSDLTAAAFTVVLRNLATGAETRFPLPPTVIANGLPLPVDHLSWAPDSRRLAISIGGGQDNEQWSLLVIDRTRDKYYVPAASPAVPPNGPKGTYYRQAVFAPNGDLFVDRECCTGIPAHVTSSVLATVDPVTGATRRQVAIGVTNRDHTSLDVDRSGHWLLYLSGGDLMVSQDGARPTTLATGFQAAAW